MRCLTGGRVVAEQIEGRGEGIHVLCSASSQGCFREEKAVQGVEVFGTDGNDFVAVQRGYEDAVSEKNCSNLRALEEERG